MDRVCPRTRLLADVFRWTGSADPRRPKRHADAHHHGAQSPDQLVVGDDGALYVSNNGVSVGAGEVLRIQP